MEEACKNDKVCTISLSLHTITLIEQLYILLRVLHCVLLEQIDNLFFFNLFRCKFSSIYDTYYKVFITSYLINHKHTIESDMALQSL